MADDISQAHLFELSRVVASQLGLHFPEPRWPDLSRALKRAAPGLGFKSTQSLAQWVVDSPCHERRAEPLAEYLTIGETHFFRDDKLFQLLEQTILRELIQLRRGQGRHLRIWSAGCATGEEPYSIAIVLSRLIPDLSGWNVTIAATDINKKFLQRAEEGVYSEWSFRSVPEGIEEAYFAKNENGREILSQIKRMVTFSYLNLASDPYPHTSTDTGSMDVILCRNVLMYFTSEHQQRAIKGFMESLVEGGWLIVSPAEASMVTEADLRPVNFPGAILFKKECKPVLTAKRADLLIQPPSVAVPAASNLDSAVVVRERTKVTKVDPARPSVSQLTPRTEEEPSCKGRSTPYMEALAIYERGLYLETVEKVLSIAEQDWLDGSERCAAFTLLSRAYANLGMLHEALKWSDQAVAFDKLNPWGHYFRGTILQECGEIQEAVRSMNRALFLDPKLVVAHFALGSLLRQVGTPRDSERHFKAALNILNSYRTDQEVAGCDGMTAGRLREIIAAMTQKEGRNA